MAVTLSPGVKALFEGKNFANVGTLNADGSPHVSAVWVELDGDNIIVNTQEGRVKPANVRRDPRVSVSIHDQNNPYQSAVIQGKVVDITHDGAEEGIHRLAKKYMDADRYPYLQPGDQRVILVIEPQHVSGMGVD
jgi:PPOX class probable F420-dependent enzyme